MSKYKRWYSYSSTKKIIPDQNNFCFAPKSLSQIYIPETFPYTLQIVYPQICILK